MLSPACGYQPPRRKPRAPDMEPLTALIVDDEPAARRDLEEVLRAVGGVRIVAHASDAAAAHQLAKRHRPQLIFMDIHLPGADGFEALKAIDASQTCVIFITAYAQFAIKAFEVGATDYLLKPVDEDRCRRAIERAREILGRAEGETRGPSIEVEQHGANVLVAADDIRLITAAGNYLEIEHANGCGLLRQTLESLLPQLDPIRLLRISRSCAVHPSFVQAYSGGNIRRLKLVFRDGRRLPVSRRRASAVLEHLREAGHRPGRAD